MTDGTCWVVSEGKAGMENQALGLAEALDFAIEIKRIQIAAPWRWLPGALWPGPLARLAPGSDHLDPPWPDLLIGCGRLSIPLSIAVRRLSAGATFTVQMQHPRVDVSNFDLVAPPRHDHLRGPNVIETRGAVHRVTVDKLAAAAQTFEASLAHLPRPLVAVLVGGSSKSHTMTPANARELGGHLKALCRDHGVGLAVTASRRTGPENERILRDALADAPAVFWDGAGDNPYFGYLGLADAVVVTEDSVSMTSEAAFTGKPVYVGAIDGGSAKFREFHDGLTAEGVTRPFAGKLEDWSPVALDDRERVADAVRKALRERARRAV